MMIAQPIERLDSSITKLARELLGDRKNLYALQIGQDRPESLLARGDVAIIQPCDQVADGGTAVLYQMDDGQASVMLRRVHRQNGQYRLAPLNPDFRSTLIDAGQITIQGKLLLIIRLTTMLYNGS